MRSSALDRELLARRGEGGGEMRGRDGCDDASDPSALENCALRCASAACYERTYASDPLEEGELDVERGREYRTCARDELRRLRGYQTFGTE